jgi:peptidoglycan/LPS O-acetylase OafA/YrhL
MPARSILAHFVPCPLSNSLEPDQNSFGVVRLALAFMVLVSHAYFLKIGTTAAEPLITWTGYTLGQHAVQDFFVLSGLLVAQSLMRARAVTHFALARALRIFPGLIVCVLVTAFFIGPLVSGLTPPAYFADGLLTKYLAKTVFLVTGSAPLPGVFTTNPASGAVNTSLWTLKYEVLCYAGLAALGALAIWSGRRTEVFCAAAALWVVSMVLHRPALQVGSGLLDTIHYFTLFFGAGVLAYAVRHRLWISGFVMIPLAIAAYTLRKTGLAEFAYAALMAYGVCWIGSLSFGAVTTFTRREDYSFGLYIYSMPISQLILHVHPTIGVFGLIVTTTCLTLPLACLSWNLIEHPAIAWSKHLRARSRAVANVAPNVAPNVFPVHACAAQSVSVPTVAAAVITTATTPDMPAAQWTWSDASTAASKALGDAESAKTRLYAAMVRNTQSLNLSALKSSALKSSALQTAMANRLLPNSTPPAPIPTTQPNGEPFVTGRRVALAIRAKHHAMA